MNQPPPLKFRVAEIVAVPFEAALGLGIAILSTQFFPRQASREPCSLPFAFFVCAAILLSLGLPYFHATLRQWSPRQRLVGLAIAGVTFALLAFKLGWTEALHSSWKEAW